jgi:hypothetical protein
LRSHWMTEMLREGHGQEHRQDTGSWECEECDEWESRLDPPDGAVKSTWTEAEALSDIMEEQIPFHFPLQSDFCEIYQCKFLWQKAPAHVPAGELWPDGGHRSVDQRIISPPEPLLTHPAYSARYPPPPKHVPPPRASPRSDRSHTQYQARTPTRPLAKRGVRALARSSAPGST